MRSSSMILRKCRIENPASSAAVGISKNIFVRAGWAAAVSLNIGLYPPFRRVLLHLVFQCVALRKGAHTSRDPRPSGEAATGLSDLPFFRRRNRKSRQETDKR